MLRCFCAGVLAAAIVLLGIGQAEAGMILLAIETGGADLAGLEVGQRATINVVLSGLEPDAELDTLAGTVVYDQTLLGVPVITAGPIIPDPLDDPLDYLISEQPGYAEATFLTFGDQPADRICGNGLFFSFDVTALAPGRELSFDYTDATMPNPDDPWDPIPVLVETTGPLPFTVVPEPGTLMRVAMLGVVLAGRRRRKNLRRAAESNVPRRRTGFPACLWPTG